MNIRIRKRKYPSCLAALTLALCCAHGQAEDDPQHYVAQNGRPLALVGEALRQRPGGGVDYAVRLYMDRACRSVEDVLDESTQKSVLVQFPDGLTLPRARRLLYDDIMASLDAELFEKTAPHFRRIIDQAPKSGFPPDTSVRYDSLPGTGTRLIVNGRDIGVIADRDFYTALLLLWIGPKSFDRNFKSALLLSCQA